MNPSGLKAAVLFDRDGTLNESPRTFVTRLEELIPIPGAFESVARLHRAGWGVAVCTNQSCIGQGIVSAKTVEEIHRECARLAAWAGGRIDGFHVCPHRPDDDCSCRKPHPGLLLEAADRHGYDLARSYFVGDSMRDLEAGSAAGATALLVLTGGDERARLAHPPSLVFADAAAAVDWILSRSTSRV
jgi:histidinol-phosphate phosphatase family protein